MGTWWASKHFQTIAGASTIEQQSNIERRLMPCVGYKLALASWRTQDKKDGSEEMAEFFVKE
jgi:hypothetical protein